MMKRNPGLAETGVAKRWMTYSKERENTDQFFEAMPTYSPTYKHRVLLNNLSAAET